MKASEIYEISDGDIALWIEQNSSIHIKAVTNFGDPVELNAQEARSLSDILSKMADQLENNQ